MEKLRAQRYAESLYRVIQNNHYYLKGIMSEFEEKCMLVTSVKTVPAQPKLVAFLESLGYETLHRSEGYSNHLHPDPDPGRVDVVYVSAETSRLLFGGGTRLHLGGHEVPVPRPEHLAAMKIHAMKNDPSRTLQEMADLQFLLGLPGIDEDEVRGYFERAGLLDRYREIERLG